MAIIEVTENLVCSGPGPWWRYRSIWQSSENIVQGWVEDPALDAAGRVDGSPNYFGTRLPFELENVYSSVPIVPIQPPAAPGLQTEFRPVAAQPWLYIPIYPLSYIPPAGSRVDGADITLNTSFGGNPWIEFDLVRESIADHGSWEHVDDEEPQPTTDWAFGWSSQSDPVFNGTERVGITFIQNCGFITQGFDAGYIPSWGLSIISATVVLKVFTPESGSSAATKWTVGEGRIGW